MTKKCCVKNFKSAFLRKILLEIIKEQILDNPEQSYKKLPKDK